MQNIPLSIPVDLPFGIKEVLHETLALAESRHDHSGGRIVTEVTEASAFPLPKPEASIVDVILEDFGVTHYTLVEPKVGWEAGVAVIFHKSGSLHFNTSKLISIIITHPVGPKS